MTLRPFHVGGLLLACAACSDLEVANPETPDAADVYADPVTVVEAASGGIHKWWRAATSDQYGS